MDGYQLCLFQFLNIKYKKMHKNHEIKGDIFKIIKV